MYYTERQTFKLSKQQKETLTILHLKYKLNISKFIRDAIIEKLEKDKKRIFKDFVKSTTYVNNFKDCPF